MTDDPYQVQIRQAAHKALDELIDRAFPDQRLLTGMFDVKIVCIDGDRDEKGDVEATYTTYSAELIKHGDDENAAFEIEEITRAIDEDVGTDTLRRVSLDVLK